MAELLALDGVASGYGESVVVDYEGQQGRTTYRLSKFRRSKQGTCINQKPQVEVGDTVTNGTVSNSPKVKVY